MKFGGKYENSVKIMKYVKVQEICLNLVELQKYVKLQEICEIIIFFFTEFFALNYQWSSASASTQNERSSFSATQAATAEQVAGSNSFAPLEWVARFARLSHNRTQHEPVAAPAQPHPTLLRAALAQRLRRLCSR